MEQTLQTITLNRIRPNPHNPRKNFAGKSFEELVASVREKGVIQPILVRPVKSKKTPFEIIFGERRFRASCVVAKANGGLAKHEIPVLVRDLDDNTSFDLMTIENLQRQDLTELEEATSFKYYIEKHGEEAAATLAERTGISAGYIRRRVAVLALPKYVLKAWDKGQLKYGHLEQLSRLKDKEQIKRLYEEIIEVADSWSPITVADLKKNIAAESPALAKALFNIKKDGCATCPQNSDVQGNLFETDTTNKKCMHPKCYKEKQAAWFAENRDKFVEKHDLKTNGFRFLDDFEWNAFETIHDWEKTPDNCKECDHLVTMLSVEGEVQRTKACIGPNDCLDKAKKEEKKQAKSKDGKSGPRVAWHGSHFLDLFFQEQLPGQLSALPGDDLKALHIALYSLLETNHKIHPWYALRHELRKKKKLDEWFTFPHGELFNHVATLDKIRVQADLRDAALQIFLQDTYANDNRQLVADHIAIDVAGQWTITEEYLKKKTKAEILDMGRALKIFDDPKINAYMVDVLNYPVDSFERCKKGELLDLFLKSGVDLAGRVPEEVMVAWRPDYKPEQPAAPVIDAKIQRKADRFRTLADNMDKQIDAKLNPPIGEQNLTPRRARIAKSMRKDGLRLQKIQLILRTMADRLHAGTLPDELQQITSKAAIDEALHNTPDIFTILDLREPEPDPQAKVKEKMAELIGAKIPGFFQTPPATAADLVIMAGIEPGDEVMEPEAGAGDIADAIREACPDNSLSVIEIWPSLREILELKGHNLVDRDFLEHAGEYDRIIMNPPFENGQDIDHLQHAYSLLKPGGRVVSIMCEGVFFREDKKSVAFRQWLEDCGGYFEELPEDTFKNAKSLRQTGVRARVVVIDKQ